MDSATQDPLIELLTEIQNDCRLGFRKSFPEGFDLQLERTLDTVTSTPIKQHMIPTIGNDQVVMLLDLVRMAACMQACGGWVELYKLTLSLMSPRDEEVLEVAVADLLLCIPAMRKLLSSTPRAEASTFTRFRRPRCTDLRDNLVLQLGLRLFLCASARWHGADNDACELIYNNHMKLRWALILGGDWVGALGDLE